MVQKSIMSPTVRYLLKHSTPKRSTSTGLEERGLDQFLLFKNGNYSSSHNQSILFSATMKGDLAKVKSILKSDPNSKELISCVNDMGWNIVFVAMYAGHATVLKYLLDMGADIESPGSRFYGLLSVACRLGRLRVIPILMEYGADPCTVNKFGVTCLHTIARAGTVEMAEMIFSNDNRLEKIFNTTDRFGMTPLHCAVAADKIDMCRWLIKRGADTNVRGGKHDTPFIAACHLGNTDIMEIFVSQDMSKRNSILHETDVDRMNGLHHAVSENNIEATLVLISWGVDVNSVTNEGSTPLHICATSGYTGLMTILIQAGAQVNARDDKSKTPLHRAAESYQILALTTLIQQGADIDAENAAGWTALFTACFKGYDDVVDRLLASKADYMFTDFMGKSCLIVAVEEKHWKVFSLLMKRCARSLVLLKDITEKTVLHEAATLNDTRFARALIQYKELIHAQDLSGQIPLHYAAGFGNIATLKLVAEKTDSIDMETHDIKTPLIIACENGLCKSALLLIHMGADVNHRVLNSNNTLMIATLSGSNSLVEVLIRSGVKVNNVNHEKNTALHLACGQGHLSIVETLMDKGASVTATNVHGETPLLAAVQQSQEEVATFLMKHRSWEESMTANDKDGLTCLVKMTAQTPKAAKVVLDNCMVTSRHQQKDINFKIKFNFKYLQPDPRDYHFREKVYSPFQTMIINNREDLLSHPLCQAFLVYKWNTFGRYYLMFNVLTHALFFMFALVYLSEAPKLEADRTEEGCNFHHATFNASTNITYKSSERRAYEGTLIITSVIGMTITLLLAVVKEIRFLTASGVGYLKSGQFLTTMLSALLVLYSFYPIGYYPCTTQWRLMAFGITLYTYVSSVVLNRIDNIGIYFSMFYEVLHTILKMAVVLVFFVLTMAIPLRIFLRLESGFSDSDVFPITALAMMAGELNYRDVFVNGDTSPFSVDAFVYFPMFVLVLNITFMNMMIGAAVGDIENVEKRAYLMRLRSQVNFLVEVESTFVSRMRVRFSRDSYVVFPNGNGRWMKLIRRFTSYNHMTFIKRDEVDTMEQLKEQIQELKELTCCMKDELLALASHQGCAPSSSNQPDDDRHLSDDENFLNTDVVTDVTTGETNCRL